MWRLHGPSRAALRCLEPSEHVKRHLPAFRNPRSRGYIGQAWTQLADGESVPNVHLYYHPEYNYASANQVLPTEIHGFVRDKPRRVFEYFRAQKPHNAKVSRVQPSVTTEDALALVHTQGHIRRLREPMAVAQALEFEELAWMTSEQIWADVVRPQLVATGGTVHGLQSALEQRTLCLNFSGGFHHARADLAHGFCLVNDVGIAVARLRQLGREERVAIIDLDVHQGDGNSAVFDKDPSVFTVSLHQGDLFPVPKVPSDLDVELSSGCDGATYMEHLLSTLSRLDELFTPDVVAYVAGTDVFGEDSLGELKLSTEDVLQRDMAIVDYCKRRGIGLLWLPAGGYSDKSAELTARGFVAAVEQWP